MIRIDEHACGSAAHHLHDLDEVRQVVAGLYCDHRLDQSRRNERLDYGHRHERLEQVSFSRMRYGAEVRVRPGALGDFYLVQMPLKGGDAFSVNGQAWRCGPKQASAHGPEDELDMHWSADCEKFVVRIERQALERHAEAVLGPSAVGSLSFAPLVDLSDGKVRAWLETAQHIFAQMQHNPAIRDTPLMRTQFEHMLLTTLLSWLPAVRPPAPGAERPILPRHVKLAEDFLQAHADQPVSIEDLSAQVGVSGRTLYEGFRKYLGVSPMRYLRDLRMSRARADLLDPARPRSVTEVATRWGFFQLGRFAIDYRQRFGESPSDTLSNRR